MKIELFIKLDCESLIYCEQIRGNIKKNIFTKPLNPRTVGGGYQPPLRFFADSEKMAALAPPNLP